ncbi:MAG: PAS domain S-box protein [Deltaproteobacteria bacterium]|nr:PAS domain S-box protein [Deltaproteobacteria bacterium]
MSESEQRFRAIFANAATAIAITDWEGGFELCNPAYCALLGYGEDELRHLHFESLVHPEDLAANVAENQRLKQGECSFFVIENRYVHKQGHVVWVQKFVSTLPDSRGRPAHVLALVTDITERRRAAAALRESEERLRVVLRAARCGAWDWDVERDDAWWSDELCDMWGFPRGERVPSDKALAAIHPDDLGEIRAAMEEAARTGVDLRCEFRVRRADGSEVWLSSYGRLTPHPLGRSTRMVGISVDVTARKRAEHEARESEHRLHAFFEHSSVVAWMKDEVGRYVFMSRVLERRLGIPRESWRGMSDFDLFPVEVAEQFRRHDRVVLEAGRAIEIVEEEVTPDRGRVSWLNSKFPYTSASGERFVGGLGVDVSERIRATEQLRDREARLTAILETAAEAILTLHVDGRIDSVNPATEKLFGYAAGELVGESITRLVTAPANPLALGAAAGTRLLEDWVSAHGPVDREVTGRHRDGRLIALAVSAAALREHQAVVAMFRDLTRQKELEAEVLDIAALEQGRLGQELHDDLAQELTGIRLLAGALAKRVAGREEEALAAKVMETVARAQQRVRAIARGLVPLAVEPETLPDALEELVARAAEQSAVECRFERQEDVRVRDGIVATHLLKIAQEALHNAIRHARPRHVWVRLGAEGGHLMLSVRDDGDGFPAGDDGGAGLGLKLMRDRAGVIGAHLAVESRPGDGTRVSCVVADGARGG